MDKIKIGIIGLGYVGLPLALEFGIFFDVIGFDINHQRVKDINNKIDKTREVDAKDFSRAKKFKATSNLQNLSKCNYFIITVPTPVNEANQPDLTALKNACSSIGPILKKGDIVIFESTVFPGCTDDECIPILEEKSGLKINDDFYCGYSPERINPGDKKNRISNIKKIVSGSSISASHSIYSLYSRIIKASLHLAPSIKIAEMAKVIENTQRDVNIALINEFSLICTRLGIDTQDVLAAASSKWNFMPFTPGLVGGHCIGVDPYYLTYKSEMMGYSPNIILESRKVNNFIPTHVAHEVVRLLVTNEINPVKASILILGVTFKENCPDYRNTKVINIINNLRSYKVNIDIFDPVVDVKNFNRDSGHKCLNKLTFSNKYDGIVVAVAHDKFKEINQKFINKVCKKKRIVYDVKGILDKSLIDGRL